MSFKPGDLVEFHHQDPQISFNYGIVGVVLSHPYLPDDPAEFFVQD